MRCYSCGEYGHMSRYCGKRRPIRCNKDHVKKIVQILIYLYLLIYMYNARELFIDTFTVKKSMMSSLWILYQFNNLKMRNFEIGVQNLIDSVLKLD